MKKNMLITEKLSDSHEWIDNLPLNKALELMIDSQTKAIYAIKDVLQEIEGVIDLIYDRLIKTNSGRLIYVGAGTSGRIAVQDGAELFPTFGWPKERIDYFLAGGTKALVEPVEGAEDNIKELNKIIVKKNISKNDVIICLAASGNTPFTCEIVKICSQIGSLTIGISNNQFGRLCKDAEFSIYLKTGKEVLAGSTRLTAGTSQKIILNLISTMVMSRLGFVKQGLMVNMKPTNQKLRKRALLIKNELK